MQQICTRLCVRVKESVANEEVNYWNEPNWIFDITVIWIQWFANNTRQTDHNIYKAFPDSSQCR